MAMKRNLTVVLAEIRMRYLERMFKPVEAMREAFDVIAGAQARKPDDLEAALDATIEEELKRGYDKYPETMRVTRPDKRRRDTAKAWIDPARTRGWLGRRGEPRPVTYELEVPESERTVRIGEYAITPAYREYFARWLAPRIAVWQARLAADEVPRWERTARWLRESIAKQEWTIANLARRASVDEKTVLRRN